MEQKSFVNELIMYACILILGICLVLWADKVTSMVSTVLGIVAIGYSIFGFYNYFIGRDKKIADDLQLVYAITMLVIGIVLILKGDFLKEVISFIIGIYILISSTIRLKETIQVGKSINKKLTTGIVLSIMGIFLGVMCILGKFLVPDIIVTYIGILLILYSVVSVVNLVIVRSK